MEYSIEKNPTFNTAKIIKDIVGYKIERVLILCQRMKLQNNIYGTLNRKGTMGGIHEGFLMGGGGGGVRTVG